MPYAPPRRLTTVDRPISSGRTYLLRTSRPAVAIRTQMSTLKHNIRHQQAQLATLEKEVLRGPPPAPSRHLQLASDVPRRARRRSAPELVHAPDRAPEQLRRAPGPRRARFQSSAAPGERARTALGRAFRRHPGQGSERQVLRGHLAVRPVLSYLLSDHRTEAR